MYFREWQIDGSSFWLPFNPGSLRRFLEHLNHMPSRALTHLLGLPKMEI